MLTALDLQTGDVLWRQQLSGQPVIGGVAIDRASRVVVVLEDGSVECFGGAASSRARIESLARLGRASEDGSEARRRSIRGLTVTMYSVQSADLRELIVRRLDELGVDAFEPASKRGSLTRWSLLAPVPWNDANPVDKVLIGEPDVDGRSPVEFAGRTRRWRKHLTIDANGKVDIAVLYGKLADVAAYAYTEFHLEEARELVLRVGSNDGYKCWFNGEAVGRFDGDRGYDPDQDAIEVSGRKGLNRLLFKVTQVGNNWAIGVRVTDASGQPVSSRQGEARSPRK